MSNRLNPFLTIKNTFFQKKAAPSQPSCYDFCALMGKEKPVWEFIRKGKDEEKLRWMQKLYAPWQEHAKDNFWKAPLGWQKTPVIPKVIHVIWLGPSLFPKTSIAHVDSWVHHHPDWKFCYWTDRDRPLPNPQMELRLVSKSGFPAIMSYIEKSDSYAEQSDLLRYAILSSEGGLYVDHDVECFHSFALFHKLDLYCGVEVPHRPFLGSSFFICNNLIGARPSHPILKKCLELIASRWEDVGDRFFGKDKDSVACRVGLRTFCSFEDAVMSTTAQERGLTVVFPAGYFNRIGQDFGLYAHHMCATTWLSDETLFESASRRRLISISRKLNQTLLLQGILLGLTFFLLVERVVSYFWGT